MTTTNLAVIVLAAGQGTRMRSKLPKVLHEIAGISMIAHVLRTAASLEPAHTMVVVRHERERVADEVMRVSPEAQVIDQDERPGTGRAVQVALDGLPADFDGDLVVLSGDVPLLDVGTVRRLLDHHRQAADAMTILSASVANPEGFGRIVRDAHGAFSAIVEQKDASAEQRQITEINAGVYAFSAAAARDVLPKIDAENEQQEYYLTDAAALIRADGGRIEAISVTDPWLVQGVNDRVQLGAVAREFNRRLLDDWMRRGVTIVDPDTTLIEADVTIGQDTQILPGTQLRGATSIAEDAIIGPDTTLVDCEVGEGAVVKRADATLAVIGRGATVGPWSYLRANTVVGEGAKVGAFVETKNSTIGDGAKVPHLSYVGDAEIGEGSNLGAGTITANYDGVAKHRTTIGKHVKIGSDNVLIAPVRVGDGAYSGAGTTIRKDVPAGALAINVAPQRNLSGWVREHRPDSPSADVAARASE